MNFYSVYPTAHNDTYVKATSNAGANWVPYYATDPAKTLTGDATSNAWTSAYGGKTNQRFHFDLGVPAIVRRIYYENYHSVGAVTNQGAQNFTFWGSNTGAGSFDDLVYANDEGWTQLTANVSAFDQHVAADQVDPKYIYIAEHGPFRYYAFKFADNYGHAYYIAVRRIELQVRHGGLFTFHG